MNLYTGFILALLLCLLTVMGAASDQPENDNKSGSEKDDEPFDHAAFLQIDDSSDIQIQNSKESKLKMRKLIREIDSDKDGKISEKELGDWIRDVISKHIVSEGEKQMPKIDRDDDKHATWEEYKAAAGYMKGDEAEPRPSSEQSKRRDKEKFDLADTDQDGKLSYHELGIMIHPDEAPHMSAVVVSEFLDGMDRNNDGKISPKEFSGEEAVAPEEMQGTFKKLDADGDGMLNFKELADWLAPKDKDPITIETQTLTQEIDDDKDGFLTEKEIFKHYAQFATSRATKYGRLLKPDEKPKPSIEENETKKKQPNVEL